MNKLLSISCFLVALLITLVDLSKGVSAVTLVAVCCFVVVLIIRQADDKTGFLVNIFFVALILRLLFGVMIEFFELRLFFAGDSNTYDILGNRLVDIWRGIPVADDWITVRAQTTTGPGWGMSYLTGIVYFFVGRNVFAAQCFCAIFGAATAPLIHVCSYKIFQNRRVSETAAILVALCPAFIIWSSQLLKDGMIIFLLVLSITMVLQLQQKFDYFSVILLIVALFGIISLRFYIFYMVTIAVIGSFVIGTSNSTRSTVRGIVALAIVGTTLGYLGVLRSAESDFQNFGSLEKVQQSRLDQSQAESGFGKDLDVSTTGGAIAALPTGFTYLMLAPFPWQVSNFRQAITLPEILVWWASIPFLLSGLWFTMKNRLRSSISILIFTLLLTIAYSIFQGNVGTAYRQRAQIQVFLFIFIAVGWTLMKERKENQQIKKAMKPQLIK